MAYATVDELQPCCRLDAPTALQTDGMRTGAGRRRRRRSTGSSATPSRPRPRRLCRRSSSSVNLDRAVEHWRQSYSPFGVIGDRRAKRSRSSRPATPGTGTT